VQKQRQLISEAKMRIRGIGKLMADLKREQHCLEQFITNDEYISATRKNNLANKWMKKLKHGQQHKTNMLKAAMGGVRDD